MHLYDQSSHCLAVCDHKQRCCQGGTVSAMTLFDNRLQKSSALQHYIERVQTCKPEFATNDLNARINHVLHLHACRLLSVITIYLFKPRLINTVAPSFVNDLYI